MLSPWLQPSGGANATSYDHTTSLQTTIERLVDFDLINAGKMRFSVGAVNVRVENFCYFDTETHTIRPKHIMASAALPPGFPPVEIEGEYYWDGGLVSNTPLQWVLQCGPRRETSFRSTCGTRGKVAGQHGSGRDAAEGNPLFSLNR